MAPTLTCDVGREADAVVIVVRGELDESTAAVLENAAIAALNRAPARLVLDVSRLGFCDSTGLSLLVKLSFRAEEVGSRLVIDQPSRQIHRLFAVTGLDTVLDIQSHDDVSAPEVSD